MFGDQMIEKAMMDGRLNITPYEGRLLGPASYDMRLAGSILELSRPPHGPMVVDPMSAPDRAHYFEKTLPTTIMPGRFYLASTIEAVSVGRDVVAQVEGKSSLGRLGLAVHVTAGFIDPGFQGHVTLELVNLGDRPLWLHEGMQIAQITFSRIEGVSDCYDSTGRYQHQKSRPAPSKGVTQ